jgi:hypothetical protein
MAREVKSDVKSILIIFFGIKGIVHKEFVLAGQAVNSVHYCDALRLLRENVRILRHELWRQKTWLLHHNNAPPHASFFTRAFLTKKQHDCRPHPHYFSVSPIEDKTERSSF